MVLNDGETYTGLAGCKIVRVEGDEPELDDGEIPTNAEVVATLSEQEEHLVLTYERVKHYPLVRYAPDALPS